MNQSILKIAHVNKELKLSQYSEGVFRLGVYQGQSATIFELTTSELASLRNKATEFLNNERRLKREREKRTGQKEINLDR